MKETKRKMGKLLVLSPDDLLEDYRLSLQALSRSPKTISWYLEILNLFFCFLSSTGIMKPIGELGTQELKSYLLHLQGRNRWPGSQHVNDKNHLSPYSIQGHVRAIKAFFSWLAREGLINANHLHGFPLPKVPQSLIRTISPHDIKRLLDGVDRGTPAGERLYCALLVLIDTGVRVSELVGLNLSDLDIPKGIMTVTGKGQKQRSVPFSNFVRKALLKYIHNARPLISIVECDYLFPAKYGDHMTVNSLQQALRRLAKKTGIPKCHPHIFRHTFATMFVSSNGSPPILKEIMGHQSLQTTEKYIHLKDEDLRKQHEWHSPIREVFKKQ